jgi:hypothetical protein
VSAITTGAPETCLTSGTQRSADERILKVERIFSPEHGQVLRCHGRFIVLVAGRRWGKTTLALWILLLHALGAPRRLCYYIAPTQRQAKEIAWRILKELVSPLMRRTTRESDLEIELLNGSIIKLHGPSSLRGSGLDFVVLDEYSDMPPNFWEEVVWPMLADHQGCALFTGTPKGFNHFYRLYQDAQSRPEWTAFRFKTEQGGHVLSSELALLRCGMDPRRFAQEMEAQFEAAQGRIYYSFSSTLNLTNLPMVPAIPLLVGMDFNVVLMTAVVVQHVGNNLQVIDEIVLPNSNTIEMVQELTRRYPRRGTVHPDPSGVARKTSAPVGQTDFTIIGEAGWKVYPMRRPYNWIDRIQTVNARLCNGNGERRLFIDPKCKNLIRALGGYTYKEGTNIPDKTSGYDHITDALGYLVMGLFYNYEVTFSKAQL